MSERDGLADGSRQRRQVGGTSPASSDHHTYSRVVSADNDSIGDEGPAIGHDVLLGGNPSQGLPETGRALQLERNFRWMSILFGANHGCVVACLSLATSRFAAVGAWQSGLLYLFYTGSALFGATGVVKRLGGRNALVAGMALYCVYVAAFLLATLLPKQERLWAYTGAAIGGLGAGFLWTAQGAYFASAAEQHAAALRQSREESTNSFGSLFAFYYLAEEVVLRALSSSISSSSSSSWTVMFGLYFVVALLTTVGMLGVEKLQDRDEEADSASFSWFHKSTAAWRLLIQDSKMKYMVGLNTVFGLSSAFLNSYVNGEVVDIVFSGGGNMIGILTAWLSIVAAGMSVVFAKLAASGGSSSGTTTTTTRGKGVVVVIGAVCFTMVALPFAIFPNVQHWPRLLLVFVYTMQGTGRATFEGTLKAIFADFFPQEKEGAFANIILQNGSASAIGYALSFGLVCRPDSFSSTHCVQFQDGSWHDVFTYEWLVVGAGILGVLGFWRASWLHRVEQQQLLLGVSSSHSDSNPENGEDPERDGIFRDAVPVAGVIEETPFPKAEAVDENAI